MPDTAVRARVGLPLNWRDRIPVRCPAGEAQSSPAGDAVRCAVEEHTISAALEPSSLARYCLGEYTACSTWQAEKERVWAARSTRLIDMPADATFTQPDGFKAEAYEEAYG